MFNKDQIVYAITYLGILSITLPFYFFGVFGIMHLLSIFIIPLQYYPIGWYSLGLSLSIWLKFEVMSDIQKSSEEKIREEAEKAKLRAFSNSQILN